MLIIGLLIGFAVGLFAGAYAASAMCLVRSKRLAELEEQLDEAHRELDKFEAYTRKLEDMNKVQIDHENTI